MTTAFTVFHTGPADEYLPYMRIGKRVLEFTNPGAEYIVLTDKETAPAFDTEFDVEVVAPSDQPLPYQYITAQLEFEKKHTHDLSVLAATDCVARRNLDDALHHPIAVTYKRTRNKRINNVAYVYDHDLAVWFLRRCLDHLMLIKHADQRAWESALGLPWEVTDEEGILVAHPDGKDIWLYPCETHNCFIKRDGGAKKSHSLAYMLHFKGAERKAFMGQYVEDHIFKDS